MPGTQYISEADCIRVLRTMASRQQPATITYHYQNQWHAAASVVKTVQETRMQLAYPHVDLEQSGYHFVPGEEVGIGIRSGGFKYSAKVRILSIQGRGDDGGIWVSVPREMIRVEKRSQPRWDIPSNVMIRASFWHGGRINEPDGNTPDNPSMSGKVVDVGPGGFRVRTSAQAVKLLESGDLVGVRVMFASGQAVFFDARYRYLELDGSMAHMGFEFVGPAQDIETLLELAQALRERAGAV